MKFTIITSWDENYNDIAMLTTPVMHYYALAHGYNFAPFKGKFTLDPDKDPSLLTYGDRCKLQIYKDIYVSPDYDCDCVVWIDVDTLITNMHVKLEDILGERKFLWTYGVAGPLSGFTMARTLPEVHLALHAVQHRAAEDAGPSAPGGRSDQDTMRFFMTMPPFDEIFGRPNLVSCKEAGHCMPFDVFGWSPIYDYLGNWEPGDFLYTVPSIPIDRRLEMLKDKYRELYGELEP